MQKPCFLMSLVAAALVAGCSSTPKQTSGADGMLNLFNGRDLTGWRAYLSDHRFTRDDVWSVVDGILACRGEPMGYLYSQEVFEDFRLVVEWRWAPGKPPGNSGILMRINGEPRPLPRCLESQLKSGSAGDLYAFHEMKLGGDPARLDTIANHELGGNISGLPRLSTAELAPGEWNVAEITVQGGAVTVLVNGVKVNEATDCELVRGPVGLQSEGGEIHFRTVRIQPL